MAQNNAALELIDLLVTRNFDPEIFDVKTGNPPVNDRGKPDNSRANQFLFHFIGDSGEDYGTVEILFADGVMTVGSGNNTGRGIENPKDKQSWYDFLLQLKKFAVRHDFANFQVDNISRMKYLRQSMAQLTESFQGRGQYSWSGQPTEARMLIKHSRKLAETDARFRHIDSIFLETADGERYRLPTRSLSHGRAMLEHIRAGGRPWDARGAHINHIVEQLQILSRFRRAHQGRLFEGDAADLVNETNNYFGSLRKNLKSLATKSGYSKYFESWQPDAVNETELVVEDLRDLFVETRIDPRIEQALPLLAKIKEHNMKEADIFEAWANRLTEGTWAIPDTKEKMAKLKDFLEQPQAVGADADNATAALGNILGDDNLFDQLEELAETDPDADARPVVQAWLNANQNYPEIMAIVRELEQEPDVDQEISMTAQDMPDRDSDMREGDNLANPLEEVHSPGAMAMFPEEQGVAEGLSKRDQQDVAEDISRRGLLKGLAGLAGGLGVVGIGNQLGKTQNLDSENVTTVNGERYTLGRPSLGAKLDGKNSAGKYKLVKDDKGNMVYIWNDVKTYGGPTRFVRKFIPVDQVNEQGVAEGFEQQYLWHGSRQKIPVLEPRQAVDTGGAAGSNQNAIYATSDPKVAIAVGGLTTPDSDTAMFPNDPQMVLFSGKIRKGENVYLHKLPFNGPDGKPQFVQGAHDREFYSIPGVKAIKPVEIKAVPVDKYLNLIRQATPADWELRKQNMKEGVAESERQPGRFSGAWQILVNGKKVHSFRGNFDQETADRVGVVKAASRGLYNPGSGDKIKIVPVMLDQKQGVAEGLSEMDKSQTPPGRDGGTDLTKKQIHLGPEHVIKAKDVAKHALKALDKSMKKSHADTPKKKGVAEGQCNMSEAGTSCPVHGMTECYMETVHTDPKGFVQPTGAAFESQLARIKSLALLK